MDKKAKKRSLGLSKTEKRIIICTAAVVLIALLIYPTVTYLVPFIKYSHAVSLMEKGSFSLTESCLLFYNKKAALMRQLPRLKKWATTKTRRRKLENVQS